MMLFMLLSGNEKALLCTVCEKKLFWGGKCETFTGVCVLLPLQIWGDRYILYNIFKLTTHPSVNLPTKYLTKPDLTM